MFQSSEVYQSLSPFFDEDYFQKQLRRLAGLPGSLYQLGLVLINAEKRGQNLDNEERQQRLHQALENLAVLSQSDRKRLFAAIAPSISNEIEAAWQVFNYLPYSNDYNRRPFRLSDASEINLARSAWLYRLIQAIHGYEQPVSWFATWAAYLGHGAPDAFGQLFAGAIDRGGSTGQEVFEILTASARGDHPTGKMGRHVVRALLCASRPDGWGLIESLLLAAQREEGLRQVILEAADEAHPDAFLRILHIVIDQNLIRFSAVVRAAAVWVGLPFEAADSKTVLDVLTRLRTFLDQPEMGQAVLINGASSDQYLALWSIAYRDAVQAIAAARPLLEHPEPDHRFAAVYFLAQTKLAESAQVLLPMIDDSDLRVAAYAFAGITAREAVGERYSESDLFERLERLIRRMPERTTTFKPIIWDWMTIQIDQKVYAGALVELLGTRPPARLLPYLKEMNSFTRLHAAKLFLEHINEDPKYREAVFAIAADRDSYIHEHLFPLLDKIKPCVDDLPQLEALLTRKTSSLRRGVIGLLLGQSDSDLLVSIDRLLDMKNEQQHLAGVELLREMNQAGRARQECQLRLAQLNFGALSEVERHILAGQLSESLESYSLEDALGLANLNKLSRPIEPRSKSTLFGLVKNIRLGSAAAAACIEALDELADQHRTEPVEVNDWQNETRTELLGNIYRGLTNPDPNLSLEDNRQRFPLAEVWERWWQERPDSQRDEDGLELHRAQAALTLLTAQRTPIGEWTQSVPKELRTFLDEPYDFHLKYASLVAYVLGWLSYLHPVQGSTAFLLDAVEEVCCRANKYIGNEYPELGNGRWSVSPHRLGYIQLAREHRKLNKTEWTQKQQSRFWGLIHYLEHFTRQKGEQYRPELEDVLIACQAGAATEDDLLMYLLGVWKAANPANRPQQPLENQAMQTAARLRFAEIRQLSRKRPPAIITEYPLLKQVIERCRDRILAIEVRRGDLPTAASAPALALRSVPGTAHLISLLVALGKTSFDRSSYAFNQDRSTVLSHLIRVSYPLETDTPDVFAKQVRAAGITEVRLVELAVYAPQWVKFVEFTLQWPGFSEAVWWTYAHTKDRQWSVDVEIRESWAAQISEYTPLTADELMDGAVDVAWFYRMYNVLGEEHWQEIYRSAALAASGSGHARARLFADAMLATVSTPKLMERVKTKRHQDAVRALGLVPLPEDGARQAEILRRYEVMQEFLRTSKQFGSQRQASEKLAAGIGMENLARTAGYADPQRLEWAMELESVADLANGPVIIHVDDLTVTLFITDLGEADLAVQRGEKSLKNIPPAAKKHAQVAALVVRRQALEQQARRMRASLETAMIRGDEFSAGEIRTLFGHPVLRVMLEQLVFVGPAGMGYPIDGGRALAAFGRRIPLAAEDHLRIAHPYDLLQSGCWHDWQHECFIAERVQPFKQVFRELYTLTQTEQDEKNFSRRYDGHQVNPRQAVALFGHRGWVIAPEEGVFKTFHSEGLVARVGFLQAFFTPAEVEGLTIEGVGFTRRGDWQTVRMDQVPPRLFSEVMRDLDLVVSVAHAGGIDPEASASTVESRATLVQETCILLNLANVRVENSHVLVNGKLGNYTIHLGSGTVHKQPGGALCIIPVHSQHRGRLFLPFVDSDPKTAEVVSKVLLLAKDQNIKDPTILEQILR